MTRRRPPREIMGHDSELANVLDELTGGDPKRDPLFDTRAPCGPPPEPPAPAPRSAPQRSQRISKARLIERRRAPVEPGNLAASASQEPANARADEEPGALVPEPEADARDLHRFRVQTVPPALVARMASLELARRPRAQALVSAPVVKEPPIAGQRPAGWAPLDTETVEGSGGPPPPMRTQGGSRKSAGTRGMALYPALRARGRESIVAGVVLSGLALLLVAMLSAMGRRNRERTSDVQATSSPPASAELGTQRNAPELHAAGAEHPEAEPSPAAQGTAAGRLDSSGPDPTTAPAERVQSAAAGTEPPPVAASGGGSRSEAVTRANVPPTLGGPARVSARRLPKEAY